MVKCVYLLILFIVKVCFIELGNSEFCEEAISRNEFDHKVKFTSGSTWRKTFEFLGNGSGMIERKRNQNENKIEMYFELEDFMDLRIYSLFIGGHDLAIDPFIERWLAVFDRMFMSLYNNGENEKIFSGNRVVLDNSDEDIHGKGFDDKRKFEEKICSDGEDLKKYWNKFGFEFTKPSGEKSESSSASVNWMWDEILRTTNIEIVTSNDKQADILLSIVILKGENEMIVEFSLPWLSDSISILNYEKKSNFEYGQTNVNFILRGFGNRCESIYSLKYNYSNPASCPSLEIHGDGNQRFSKIKNKARSSFSKIIGRNILEEDKFLSFFLHQRLYNEVLDLDSKMTIEIWPEEEKEIWINQDLKSTILPILDYALEQYFVLDKTGKGFEAMVFNSNYAHIHVYANFSSDFFTYYEKTGSFFFNRNSGLPNLIADLKVYDGHFKVSLDFPSAILPSILDITFGETLDGNSGYYFDVKLTDIWRVYKYSLDVFSINFDLNSEGEFFIVHLALPDQNDFSTIEDIFSEFKSAWDDEFNQILDENGLIQILFRSFAGLSFNEVLNLLPLSVWGFEII